MMLGGCGRQVTGLNQPNGGIVPAGQTLIRFETNGSLDFQNLTYLIVLNTSGNLQQPYAQGYNTDFRNWSFFFIVGGGAGYANTPGLFQVYQDPSSGAARSFSILPASGTVTFVPTIPSGFSPFGFQITFNRCILDRPPPVGTPTTVGTNETRCPPYTFISPVWNISLFTVDQTQSPVDSLGVNGASDVTYKFSIDTSQVINDQSYSKPASNSAPNNTHAQINGIEVFSTP